MENKELFQLRKSRFLDFTNPQSLYELVNNILTPEKELPLVYGYEDFAESEWNIKYFKPIDKKTELTLDNFLEGLNIIVEKSKEKKYEKHFNQFYSSLIFNVSDRLHLDSFNEPLLSVSFGLKTAEKYKLKLFWKENEFYKSTSSISDYIISETMKCHIGPNIKK
jgi:hypothetical protein